MIVLAKTIARKAHEGQFRRDGKTPYITHPERVAIALMVKGAPPRAVATAWLHDVIEDTSWTVSDLCDVGLPLEVVQAVRILTKLPGDGDYETYIDLVSRNVISRMVKTEDILDNLSDAPSPAQIARYTWALKRLTGVV